MKKNPEKDSSLKFELKEKSHDVQLPKFPKGLPKIADFGLQSPAVISNERRHLNKSSSVLPPEVPKKETSESATKKKSKEQKYEQKYKSDIYRGPLVNTTNPVKIENFQRVLNGYIDMFSDIRDIVPIIFSFSRTKDPQVCQNLLLASTGQQTLTKEDTLVKNLNELYKESFDVRFFMKVIIDMFWDIDFGSFCSIMKNTNQYCKKVITERVTTGGKNLSDTASKSKSEIKSSLQRLQASQTYPPNPPSLHSSNMHLLTNENEKAKRKLKRSNSLPTITNPKPNSQSSTLVRGRS